MKASEVAVVIPAYEPDERLVTYAQALAACGFYMVVVVNDGSGEEYDDIFYRVDHTPSCHVLGYPDNRGKGNALKRGFSYLVLEGGAQGVITADSDGQHTPEDTLRMAQELTPGREEIWLGSRDFSLAHVPFKSRWGNRCTSLMFMLMYGRWLPDTQTGMRGATREMMDFLIAVPGERFEYEMNVLVYSAGQNVKLRNMTIETVYIDENKSSHFRPLHDSMRIYRILFSNFFRFASSSALATILDFALFALLDKWLLPVSLNAPISALSMRISPRIAVATALARIASATVNFKLNKTFVFNIRMCKGAFARYAVLCAVVMALSAVLVTLLSDVLGLPSVLAKCVVDVTLFLVNYRIQRSWVFRKDVVKK